MLAAVSAGACGLLYDASEVSRDFGRDETGAGEDGGSDVSTEATIVDAPFDRSDATPRFCASHTPDGGFCDDFDEGALGARWTRSWKDGGEGLALDQVVASSPPYALKATSAASITSTTRVGPHLVLAVPPSKSLRVAFDLRVDGADPDTRFTVLEIVHTPDPGGTGYPWTASLKIYKGATTLAFVTEPPGDPSFEVIRDIDGGTFASLTRVTLEFQPNGMFTVDVGGAAVASVSSQQSVNPRFEVRLGVVRVDSIQSVAVRYDDVVVEH
jgi:hypothetical protein